MREPCGEKKHGWTVSVRGRVSQPRSLVYRSQVPGLRSIILHDNHIDWQEVNARKKNIYFFAILLLRTRFAHCTLQRMYLLSFSNDIYDVHSRTTRAISCACGDSALLCLGTCASENAHARKISGMYA